MIDVEKLYWMFLNNDSRKKNQMNIKDFPTISVKTGRNVPD